MSKTPVPKYRPSLTAAQIEQIIHLSKQDISNPLNLSLITVLAPFKAKIDNEGLVPAYSATPRSSLLEQLSSNLEDDKVSLEAGDKEAYWEQCYLKMQKLGITSCSLAEIQAANEYRYLNDLMSEEEVAAFELKA